MIQKLRAIGLILGFIQPVADLVRAIGAVRRDAPRIAGELELRARAEIYAAFYALRHDIDKEIEHESSLQALKTALANLEQKMTEAAQSGALKNTAKCIAILALALTLAPAGANAQIHVAYSPNPQVVTSKLTGGVPSLKGLKLYDVIACNPTATPLSTHTGSLLTAAMHEGIAVVGPAQTAFLFTRMKQLHPKFILLAIADWALLGTSVLAGLQTVQLPQSVVLALPIASQGLRQASDKLLTGPPDFALLAKAMLEGEVTIDPFRCDTRIIFATSGPDKPVEAEVLALPISVAPPAAPAK